MGAGRPVLGTSLGSTETRECAEARQAAPFCGKAPTLTTKTYFKGVTLPKRDQSRPAAGSRDEKLEAGPRMGRQRWSESPAHLGE